MPNIKFSYLYRDAGNYKIYGEVIFSNPECLSIEELQQLIISKLIDKQWFYAKDWNLPNLHFYKLDEDMDHGFHEFEGLSYTEQEFNASFSLSHFCRLIKNLTGSIRLVPLKSE